MEGRGTLDAGKSRGSRTSGSGQTSPVSNNWSNWPWIGRGSGNWLATFSSEEEEEDYII